MKPFPTHANLASWAGMCPGNEESAGKRVRSRITPGNRWLKRTLAQATWAASHTKNSYLASQYRRLAGRRGRKRALTAVGHSILVIFYHMLKAGTNYTDLGGDFFDRLEPQRSTRYYVKRLESLGHKVTLESCAAACLKFSEQKPGNGLFAPPGCTFLIYFTRITKLFLTSLPRRSKPGPMGWPVSYRVWFIP
jgi:transposase